MDFYLLLGLERTASLDEVKRAYKRLARKYHPDLNPGDRAAAMHFQQIATAYETLCDAERRRRYDDAGMTAPTIDEPTFGFEGFDFSVVVSEHSTPTFGDLFAEILQPRTPAPVDRPPMRGTDLHHEVTLSFEEAVQGGRHVVTLTRHVPCQRCHGRGHLEVAESECRRCQGVGSVKSARGHMVFSKPCGACGGSGRQRLSRCPSCEGRQVEVRTEPLTIAVPPGLSDGARVRIPERGHAGRDGGQGGDLYLTVHVEPHPVFRREGADLHVMVPIAVHEAALGIKCEVPSLDGPARLRVPPGTQSGQRFRLRERGVASPRTGRRGDLVVEVRVVLPTLLDERSKDLMREFGRINSENVRRELTLAAAHAPRARTSQGGER
jgi:molecular chaperone DnaJ